MAERRLVAASDSSCAGTTESSPARAAR